ncbi:MAG: hypothetical protein PHX61_02280 [Alphaproteobacteria bacterium]|nr:hypothetical protein [Alphaproteobacteria bacterium]
MAKVYMSEEEFEELRKRTGRGKHGQKVSEGESRVSERHERRRETHRTEREREEGERKSARETPLGYVESHLRGGPTPTTLKGRRAVGAAREKIGRGKTKVREKIAPVREAIAPFYNDFSTMMAAPRYAGGKHKGQVVPQPFMDLAPPSYFGGIPNYFGREEPKRQSGRKRKTAAQKEPGSTIWEGMMDVPESAKRWM